jgi:uncharacterized protein YyaL (SSP411 family)
MPASVATRGVFRFLRAALVVGVLAAGHPSAAAPVTAAAAAKDAPIAWRELDAAAFTRARAEGRLVLIDGSAEWCHWCHVMDATTYRDPAVRRLLDASFVPVRVDIDEKPDFEERYRESGWPATVILSADGAEVGRYKGYQPPAKFIAILRSALTSRPATGGTKPAPTPPTARVSERDLAEVAAWTSQTLDGLWDAEQGGWGTPQKLPLAWDNAWMFDRARRHDGTHALEQVLFTLDQQRKIIDPVWGGLCQYSTDADWLHPHFEKLVAMQAGAIDNFATAYALTGDAAWLATARQVRGFVDRFMTGPDGAFYATMDADLDAHDPSRTPVSGHDYYARDDADRRALGIPRVDRHEYPRENGLVIAAFTTLGEVSSDAGAIAAAERAAAHMLATHGTDRGGLTHLEGDPGPVLYLADAAGFGFGLMRLYEATHAAAHLQAAARIAAFLLRELAAPGGGFFESTPSPDAVGVLAERRVPFEDDVMAARFLARLARAAPSEAYRDAIAGAIAAVATHQAIDDRGRMIGDLLLALEETRGLR